MKGLFGFLIAAALCVGVSNDANAGCCGKRPVRSAVRATAGMVLQAPARTVRVARRVVSGVASVPVRFANRWREVQPVRSLFRLRRCR